MKRGLPRKGRDFEAGFTLLEILVAFSILAITLGILLQIFSKGIHLASTGEQYSRALLLAESMLDTVGRTEEIEVGESAGEIDDFYEWSIAVRLYEDEDLDAEVVSPPFSLYRVQVSVRFENRAVVLETLRFGPRV
ncbi:MAG: type II secretion system GspH family protein [Methylococcaceae bacterium]|nr:type II secretion system GspH family protein [Methylococcaceae bacterium]